ncbi:hypothetical protein MIZ03_2186 [Rhodoferax lithotrophicus]|uniref:Diguanylate cyclase n=1 Tax=Rhodoferax lithotrophicus TaxID=2798804 RepID=A0ABN6D6T8_9BURK|nr:sensor domain-containing diguanylate cyclase [Rhodoferax sp. MIZ03]BCO27298.1 hypothetical protein MIZ03_2186 [Rhodoferax sp. MIZ03]
MNALSNDSLWAIVGITLANVLEALLGWWLLVRNDYTTKFFDSLTSYLRFIGWASLACLAGAIIGPLSLLLADIISPANLKSSVVIWWMGDTLGVVLITPLILAWRTDTSMRPTAAIRAEGLFLLGATFLAGQAVFLNWFSSYLTETPKGYWIFLFICFVSLRLGPRGSAFAVLMVSIQALFGVYRKIGLFANDVARTDLDNYWTYILILSVTAMAITTSVKASKDALRKLRLKDSALNAMANGIVITDDTGRIEWINNAASQLTGYSSREAIGQNPRDLLKSGEHGNDFYKSLWDTILSRKVWHGEIINRRKDASQYHEEMTITPLVDEDDRITHFVAVKQDVTKRFLAQQQLAYSEALFHGLFQNMSSGVAVYTAVDDGQDFLFKDINRSVEVLEKINRSNVIGKRLTEVFPGVKEFGLFAVLQRVLKTGKSERFLVTFYSDQHIQHWRDNHVYRLPSGEVVAIYDDVTAQKQAEAAVQESHQKLFSLLDSMAEGAYGVDSNGDCTFANSAFLRLLGYGSQDEVLGKHTHELIHHSHADGSHYPASECRMYIAYQKNQSVHCSDDVFWRKDGTSLPVEYWARPILSDGIVTGAIATFVDISERKKAEVEIRQLAFYDALTKLPNRRLLNDRLTQGIAVSQRTASHGALLILDLDNFKSLNDTQGHLVGDLLLKEAARRLVSCVREIDTVARFGGDEFVVLLNDLGSDKRMALAHASMIAEKIRESLLAPYLLNISHDALTQTIIEHRSSASIGGTVFLGDEATYDNILKWADSAMYRSKDAGRNAVHFHEIENHKAQTVPFTKTSND